MSSTWYVETTEGKRYGPADEALLTKWACEGRVPPDAHLVSEGGERVAAAAHPWIGAIVRREAPPVVPAGPVLADDGIVSTFIPFRNLAALTGYYVSVFSLIPVLALVLGPLAIGLGVSGLRARSREPRLKGTAHAVVAIVLGSLTFLANAAIIMAIAAFS